MERFYVLPEIGVMSACDSFEEAQKWAAEDAKEAVSLEGDWKTFSGGFLGRQYYHPNGNPYRRGWILKDLEVA